MTEYIIAEARISREKLADFYSAVAALYQDLNVPVTYRFCDRCARPVQEPGKLFCEPCRSQMSFAEKRRMYSRESKMRKRGTL
jgi:hypothetical protein